MSFSMLPLGQVTRDASLQLRVAIDADKVAEYAEWLKDNPVEDLPPIECVREKATYWLWSGYHRLEAYIIAGRKKIPVRVTDGTKRDAWIKALGANATNGKERSPADARKAVIAALSDPEIAAKSDRTIGRDICKVSPTTVGKIRRELTVHVDNGETSPRKEIVRRDGTTMRNPAATKAAQVLHDPPHTTRAPIRQQEEAEVPFDQLEATGTAKVAGSDGNNYQDSKPVRAVGPRQPKTNSRDIPEAALDRAAQALNVVEQVLSEYRPHALKFLVVVRAWLTGESFTPPSIEEVRAYCAERGNKIDPEQWHAYYSANGWMVGKQAMKSWKGAVVYWEKNQIHRGPKKPEMFSGIQEWLESQEGEQ